MYYSVLINYSTYSAILSSRIGERKLRLCSLKSVDPRETRPTLAEALCVDSKSRLALLETCCDREREALLSWCGDRREAGAGFCGDSWLFSHSYNGCRGLGERLGVSGLGMEVVRSPGVQVLACGVWFADNAMSGEYWWWSVTKRHCLNAVYVFSW